MNVHSQNMLLAQANSVLTQFSSLSEEHVVFLWLTATVIIVALVVIIGALIRTVGSIIRHRAEVDLKRELVERGMSVDEIERVVSAKAGAAPSRAMKN